MKKITLLVLAMMFIITAVACGKKDNKAAAIESPAAIMDQTPEIEKNNAYGDFGKIEVNSDGEWVDINGEEGTRSLRTPIDEDAQDEEVRWGDKLIDWIRRSN